MGLDVALEDEFGEVLDSVSDDDGLLAEAWPAMNPSFPLLRYVDTEGSTTFNRLQLEAALPEFEAIEKSAGPALKPLASRILKLARKGASEPHLFLAFLGD